MATTASALATTDRLTGRRFYAPRTGDRNDRIADLRAGGASVAEIADRVGATLDTVTRALAVQAAADRECASLRLSETAEQRFAAAMAGRSFEDVSLKRTYRAPLFSRTMLPPGR